VTLPLLERSGRIGDVAYEVLGEGGPTTVFVHGLGGSLNETRPLALGVPGTRVLLDLRGHGASAPLGDGWDYDTCADDVLAVADAFGADRAVGLSLGSGALLRVLQRDPTRFVRLGLVLPAALDGARADGATRRLDSLGDAIDAADPDAVLTLLLAEVPAELAGRRAVRLLLARRAAALVQQPAPRPRRPDRPVMHRDVLLNVTAPVLVAGQPDDPLHPLDLAAEIAAVLPAGELLTLPVGGFPWTAARPLRQALATHLTEERP
jgi:pimeloyl-ACP methyl ester carboxylesterase